MTQPPDLRSLSRPGGAAVPRPPTRWGTRVLLPAGIILVTAGMLGYSALDSFMPTVEVWVAPVVVREDDQSGAAAAAGEPAVLVQAPGWVEPNPFAITVQALAEGVIEQVLVLEGQSVEADQVVAKMIEADARLAVRSADADFEARLAALERAKAEHKASEARASEVEDELRRKRPLVESGGISAGQLARLELRLSAAERERDAASAAIEVAEADVKTHRVMCEEARLRHSRMEIRSPARGTVMQRLVEPGTRISMNAPQGEGGTMGIIRIYDPAHLQVRVDVPLADAGKVAVGTRAEVEAEAAPGVVFVGAVVRVVHEANIQRNTVQFKVAIENPSPVLKPEMLTRVRFVGSRTGAGEAAAGAGSAGTSTDIDRRLLQVEAGSDAKVWLVDRSAGGSGPLARLRAIKIDGHSRGDRVRVLSGLNPGDRLVVDPPATLREGARLKILGEKGEVSP